MNHLRQRYSLLLLIIVLTPVLCLAQIPTTVALQGQLFSSSGMPLPDGNYLVTIAFHDGIDGDPIPVCHRCMVEFYNGVFQAVIGGPESPLPVMDRQYWVSVSINGEELYPRMALHSVPFAQTAKTAEFTPGVIPVGGLIPFAGTTTASTYYLPADGRAVSSKEYPALFTIIGKMYGDGSNDDAPDTDFNLPDTRNTFIKGGTSADGVTTFSDPVAADRVRLDNNAKGNVLEPGVMSTNELVEILPSATFTFLIRVR